MALTNILEELERTIYESFRLCLVEENYLPDITNYDVENSDLAIARAAQEAYKNAVISISEGNKGFAIELFSNSTSQQRGNLKTPRIVLETEGFYPGELGLDTTTKYYPNSGGTYNKVISPSETSNFYFNVHLVANTTKQIRVLHAVNSKTLPRRGYIKWYNRNFQYTGNLFLKYISFAQNEFEEEGIVEKIYRYMVPDVHEIDDRIIGTAPPIVEINYNEEIKIK